MGKSKKKAAAPSKKSVQKVKKKVVEDRTFGLKNKNKSKKVQRYVKQVEQAVASSGVNSKQARLEERRRKAMEKAKKEAAARDQMVASLFTPVITNKPVKQLAKAGVNPKSQLCAYFKAGKCNKGKRCKFSHDLSIERKVEKINLYEDPRKKDTIDKWDQAKLESVVLRKAVGKPPESKITCKYFLDAIEEQKYGWFWECPNGKACHYRHFLPKGFVFKPKKKNPLEEQDEEDGPTLEEQIEAERAKLDHTTLTPVTYDTFMAWKARKAEEAEKELESKMQEAELSKGKKATDILSGRALFTFDPTLFVDDDDAEDEYEIEEDEDFKEQVAKAAVDTGLAGATGAAAGPAPTASTDASTVADVAAAVDASLFLDDDFDIPDDDNDDDEE